VLDRAPELLRVARAIRRVEREEPGEEEHLAREEDPHPEVRGVRLLRERLEVGLLRRVERGDGVELEAKPRT
jgi:hypothetical protein